MLMKRYYVSRQNKGGKIARKRIKRLKRSVCGWNKKADNDHLTCLGLKNGC
jgi:hypothetical protein